MGIARFYRWMSERYPLINEVVDVDNVPEFDNFYLDMNGIIHNCSHGNSGGQKQASEEYMWLDVFKYISGLVYRIKPKKLVYLAVDGVAPRAKMNQQRSRRFRSAHDARESREKNEKMNGTSTNDKPGFDSNCITPGTAFMERLVHHLEFFVQKKLAEDPLWRDLKVVISGPDVPGEGEHKIMDYIRSSKSQPDYDPNTRHCLYGLDADLIMLSLASHEPYFCLLREEIDFSFTRTKSKESRSMVKPDKFQLLHVSLLREYLGIDFCGNDYIEKREIIYGQKSILERVIDDFIFFSFLVGNDFLPHLPFSEIGDGGLNKLFSCYKELMQEIRPTGNFLVEISGKINFNNLFKFLNKYIKIEQEIVQEMVENDNWKIGQTRICNTAIGDLIATPAETLFLDDSTEAEWKQPVSRERNPRPGAPTSVTEAIQNYNQIKLGISDPDSKAKHVYAYLEGLQWVYYYYYKGPPSWDWYFPYHYSPFAMEVVEVLATRYNEGIGLSIEFVKGKPFLPFQQLMAVLPPVSGKNFLPYPLYNLMVSPTSPIRQYYPEEFQIDIDGVRVPWGGVTIIPFVDEKKLVKAIDSVIADISLEDARRNVEGAAKIYTRTPPSTLAEEYRITSVRSTIPSIIGDIESCDLLVTEFHHQPIPKDMDIFPHWLIEGFTPTAHADFPSLFKDRFEVSYSIGTGVRVFNSTSKKESIMITLGIQKETYLSIEQLRGGGHKLVSFNYPFYTKKFSIVSYSIPGERTRFVKGGGPQRELWNKHEADVDYLMSKLGESGLLVNVSTDDMEIFYSQPVIELLDKTNGETIKCLGSLAVIAKVSTTSTPRGERETTTPQTHVPPRGVCLNIRDELIFGRPYRVQNGKYLFEKIPSISSCEATRLGIVELLKLSQSVKYTQWHSSLEISRLVGISPSSVWAIFGEVWIRFGKFQEEVGMNLWSYSSHGEPQCVPGYSRFVPSVGKDPSKRRWNKWDKPNRFEWVFSLHAVAALRQLISDQPELVAEIEQTVVGVSDSQIDGGITIQGKRLFSRMRRPSTVAFGNRDDWISEFHLTKIVSYINSKPFKNLSICNWQYEHIDSAFVPLIDSFITRLRAELDLLPGGSGTVNLHSIDEKFLYPLTQQTVYNSLKFSSPPVIGQRGIYIKSRGVVEVGSWGTIIGVYGVDRDQRLDILLDIPSLNASSLNGTCPDMKGIRISASDWRAFPDQFRTPPVKDMEITKLRNKILADLIIHMGKSGIPAPSSDQQAKAEILAMLKPKAIGGHPVAHSASADVGGRIDSSTAQQGARKVSVNDLFSSSRPLGSSESSTSAVAARRLQPPTVMLHKDLVAQLHAPRVSTQPPGTGSTNNSPPKIPDFLLSKLRQPPKKE